MDKLYVAGIRLSALIGTYEWEQTTPQALLCDVVFETDAAAIAKTDDLAHAINYAALTESIQHFVASHHFQLIETLADKLATYILANFPTRGLQLTLHKPEALKPANVMITIERTRDE